MPSIYHHVEDALGRSAVDGGQRNGIANNHLARAHRYIVGLALESHVVDLAGTERNNGARIGVFHHAAKLYAIGGHASSLKGGSTKDTCGLHQLLKEFPLFLLLFFGGVGGDRVIAHNIVDLCFLRTMVAIIYKSSS